MDSSIQTLANGIWENSYLCKLAILDHLRECLEKDNLLKAKDTPKTDQGYSNLDKELMDLKILLELYFINNNELYNTRLQKFLDNMQKD